MPEFFMIFAQKCQNFTLAIARKIFAGILLGHVPPCLTPIIVAIIL